MNPSQRYELIRPILNGECSVKQVHQTTGVPISTLYWLLKRFRQEGMEGLADKSHASHDHPNWLTQEQKNQVLRYKMEHPHLTPRLIAEALAQDDILPIHEHTVANILQDHGLNTPFLRTSPTN